MDNFEPEIEACLWREGLDFGGLDEAGRGALAGPVSAGVVVLAPDAAGLLRDAGVRDSKQLTALQREGLAPLIKNEARDWGIGFTSAEEIDLFGILKATKLAALRAVDSLSRPLNHLLTDYLILPELDLPQTALVKGDQRCVSIAAASILAKVARDAWMREAERLHPGYGFAQHKGYGTRAHRTALVQLGRCPIHRKTFHFK